jgi:hypothetical protein
MDFGIQPNGFMRIETLIWADGLIRVIIKIETSSIKILFILAHSMKRNIICKEG